MTTIRPALEAAARATIAARTEAVFRRAGALLDGHFLLPDGHHGDVRVETAAVLADPAATSELCAFWAASHRDGDGDGAAGREVGRARVDLVAGPPSAGAILAFETARQLELRASFGGQRIAPGERVLLVDDILVAGGPLPAMIPVVEELGGEVVECAVLVDGSGGRPTLTSSDSGRVYPLRALWRPELPTYPPGPETCPRCAAGAPLHPPGSVGAGP